SPVRVRLFLALDLLAESRYPPRGARTDVGDHYRTLTPAQAHWRMCGCVAWRDLSLGSYFQLGTSPPRVRTPVRGRFASRLPRSNTRPTSAGRAIPSISAEASIGKPSLRPIRAPLPHRSLFVLTAAKRLRSTGPTRSAGGNPPQAECIRL